MKRFISAALFAAAFIATAAHAQGFYVGAHIGQMTAKGSCDDFSGLPGVSCDDSDTAWKVLAGYQVNRNFAAELGYIDFGKVQASGPGGTASAEATAFDLVGVGILPVADRFSVYGKLGFYHGTVDAKVRTITLNADASDDSTDLTFGFGGRFDLTTQFGLRAEWQRYSDVGGSDTGKSDIDVISLGAIYRF